jgi:phage anti-repressor protein
LLDKHANMELQVLVSKKGTKVVTATNLHAALQLPRSTYRKQVKNWLKDVYEFNDGVRRPLPMTDFAKRNNENSPVDDYYLSIELAKHIALHSNSKYKRKFANKLRSLEDDTNSMDQLSVEQVMTVLELTKVMGLTSCQAATERGHMKRYIEDNGSAAGWWDYRSTVLGYSAGSVKEIARRRLPHSSQKSQKDLLLKLDKYETVRTGMIDLFMAMGKDEQYAQKMGSLAKSLATKMEIEVWDDRKTEVAFTATLNEDLVHEIRELKPEKALRLWAS